MIRLDDATGDILLARLKQLGAHALTNITSRLYYIDFKFEPDIKVSYVYNINAKDQYFLQRISPYPLSEGIFSNHEEIVDFIEWDIKQFKNASHSTNFKRFLEINNTLSLVEHNIENLFLNYNVPKESIDLFHDQLTTLNASVQKAQEKSTPIMLPES